MLAHMSRAQPLPNLMNEVEYLALPEDLANTIEVVHGHVIVCESPKPQHQRVARRLATALENARPAEPCLRAETDTDVVLWRLPSYTFRRPDVVVYHCLKDRNTKPEAADVLLVVEVSSPSTATEDLVDKAAQYAAAGIPAYLVAKLTDDGSLSWIREFHLDAATRQYRLHSAHVDVLTLEFPCPLAAPFTALTD